MSTLEELLGGRKNVIGGPFGSKLTQKDYTNAGVPVIRGSNMISTGRWLSGEFVYVSEEKVEADLRSNLAVSGDIVVTQRGTLGQVAIVPEEHGLDRYVISQSQMAVRVPERAADRDFVYYFLQSPQFVAHVETSTIQTGVPHINLGILRSTPATWPAKEQQTKLASILTALDDKIELNRRMNETLEAMARAIFKDWFVDFGPTRAKAEGRAPYLAPELWDLFPDALDDEDKPEGWEAYTLANLAVTNSESWTARHHPPTVEYVDLSNTKWGNIEVTTLLDWEAAPSRARRIAKTGDTIMATTRPGNGSFAYISKDGFTVSTGFAVLSPRKVMYRDAVYIAATSVENIERLANLADGHGGAYPAVKPNEVSDTFIMFPGDKILGSFADLVQPIRKKIENAKAESRSLAQTRDLLLPKLMSGEIRLHEAEKELEAVA